MLQARLELAPRLSPDWILSPTRLPIPPLERGLCSIKFSKMLCFSASTDLSKNLTFSQLFLGRVPLERGLNLLYCQLPRLSQNNVIINIQDCQTVNSLKYSSNSLIFAPNISIISSNCAFTVCKLSHL